MAKVKNEGTPQECISGRIGNIIIVQGKNGTHLRKRAVKKHRPSESEGSRRARHRFAMATCFIRNAVHIVRLGIWPKSTNAFSQAISELLKHALREDHGECFVDYSKVVLSKGTLAPPEKLAVHSLPSGEIALNYHPPKNNGILKELVVALYNPLANIWDCIKNPFLGDGNLSFKPTAFDVLEVYVFVRHADGSNASRSIYLGPVSFAGA